MYIKLLSTNHKLKSAHYCGMSYLLAKNMRILIHENYSLNIINYFLHVLNTLETIST